MKYAVLAVAAIAAISFFAMSDLSYDETDALFETFVQEYKRSYFSQEEYNLRKANFQAFLKVVDQRNAVDTATHGITQFADWSQEEFMGYLTLQSDANTNVQTTPYRISDFDHLDETTEVKDQGACGSCWAFSANEAVESSEAHIGGDLHKLSEQRLLDCAFNLGCNGGGWMTTGIDNVLKNQPFSYEEEYPYKAVKGTCSPTKATASLKVTKRVSGSGQDFLTKAVVDYAPSVAVDASTWSSYTGGVMTNCGKSLNHGVQVVGTLDNAWVVRNSWGQRWGEKSLNTAQSNGYIRLAEGNTCGLMSEVHYLT